MRPLRITHAVRSDSFAGVERYVSEVATELAARGHVVTVIGGDPALMRSALPAEVTYRAASTSSEVARKLTGLRSQDIVHAHMSAAEVAAVLTRPIHRASVVATRHFAARRGRTGPSRLVTRAVARGLALEISISQFVADRSGPGSVVLHNGVRDQPAGEHRDRTVLVMQRLEAEKDTATAVRAFAAADLASDGWRLQLAGRGSEEADVRSLAQSLGVDVEVLGFVADPSAVLSRAGILLAPAPAEPFGLTVVEAMASGTPVLAAAGGAHAETLGTQAHLFPPGAHEMAAAGLRALAADDGARRADGVRLRARQQQMFGVERHAAALLDAYAGLVS